MRTTSTNVAVIGARTAGLAAYRAARAEGATAVIIEGGPYGTTCARAGCMPSSVEALPAEDRLAGYARFIDDGLLQVGGHAQVRAASVVIATGSKPIVPEVLSGRGAYDLR